MKRFKLSGGIPVLEVVLPAGMMMWLQMDNVYYT